MRHLPALSGVGQRGGGVDEELLLGLQAPDAAGLDGPGLAALRRLLLLPQDGPLERQAAQDPLYRALYVVLLPVVLGHVAEGVRRHRPDQRLRGLKRRGRAPFTLSEVPFDS